MEAFFRGFSVAIMPAKKIYNPLIPQHKILWELQVYEKQSSQTLGYVRSFTYLGAANITSKQKSDMTKVAIKNENIISFDGVFHIMDVFSKLGFEKLTESVLGKRGSSGKAFCYGSIFGSLFFSYLCGGECLEDINVLIE